MAFGPSQVMVWHFHCSPRRDAIEPCIGFTVAFKLFIRIEIQTGTILRALQSPLFAMPRFVDSTVTQIKPRLGFWDLHSEGIKDEDHKDAIIRNEIHE